MMFFFWFGSVWFWILGRYVWRVRVHRFFFFAPHLEINENEELRYLERLRYSLTINRFFPVSFSVFVDS